MKTTNGVLRRTSFRRTGVVLGALVLSLLNTGSVRAADFLPEADSSRLYEFNFYCTLEDVDSESIFNECTAAAKVYAYVNSGDSNTQELGRAENQFAVICDEELLYAAGATLGIGQQAVSVRGLEGWPSLVIKRDSLHDFDTSYPAILKYGDERLKGTCTVENHPYRPHVD